MQPHGNRPALQPWGSCYAGRRGEVSHGISIARSVADQQQKRQWFGHTVSYLNTKEKTTPCCRPCENAPQSTRSLQIEPTGFRHA